MNKILQFIILMFFITSCRKQHDIVNGDTDKYTIEFLRSDIKKQTGYNDQDSNFVNSNFKSVVDWETYRQISEDTIYVKVNVIDRVEVLWDSSRIDIKDNVWIKAVKSDQKWHYSTLTFIKGGKQKAYSGAIASQSLGGRVTKISFFLNDEILRGDSKGNKLKAGFPPMMMPNCVPGYVEGYLNTVVCSGNGGDNPGSYEDWLNGSPGDYNHVNTGGSGGGGTNNNTVANFNNRIDDTNLPDCMKRVLDALKTLSGNSVADIIKKFSGEIPGYNLNFELKLDNNIARSAWVNPEIKNGYVTINFNSNSDVTSNATDLAVATTILHESVHAYLVAWANSNDKASAQLEYPELFNKYLKLSKNIDQNSTQHDIMVKDFVNDIAISLEQFGKAKKYDYPQSYYKDLAWKGLDGTSAFSKLDSASQTRIRDIIKAEQYGIIKEGTPRKGTKLGC